jgi:hypothetical protein
MNGFFAHKKYSTMINGGSIMPLFFLNERDLVNYIYPTKYGLIDRTHLVEMNLRPLPFIVTGTGQNFGTIFGHVLASGSDCITAMGNAMQIVNQLEFVLSSESL